MKTKSQLLKTLIKEEVRKQLKEVSNKVIFSVDNEKLDSLLNSKFANRLDYQILQGDSYYVLDRNDFEKFIDQADSSGYNVDSINQIRESLEVKDFEVIDKPTGGTVVVFKFAGGKTLRIPMAKDQKQKNFIVQQLKNYNKNADSKRVIDDMIAKHKSRIH